MASRVDKDAKIQKYTIYLLLIPATISMLKVIHPSNAVVPKSGCNMRKMQIKP